MEDLPKWVQAFIDSRPPWNYVLGGVALAIFLAPKLMELHAGWRDFRLGRRDLDLEERRLTLLKLRYDIEVLRKLHDLPDLSGGTSGAPAAPTAAAPAASIARSLPMRRLAAGGRTSPFPRGSHRIRWFAAPFSCFSRSPWGSWPPAYAHSWSCFSSLFSTQGARAARNWKRDRN